LFYYGVVCFILFEEKNEFIYQFFSFTVNENKQQNNSEMRK